MDLELSDEQQWLSESVATTFNCAVAWVATGFGVALGRVVMVSEWAGAPDDTMCPYDAVAVCP